MTGGRVVAACLGTLAGLLLVGAGGMPATTAGFTDAATFSGGGFTSTSMTAPAVPAVQQVRGSGSTRVTWTAPTMGEHGGAPSSYDVLRYPAASGGSADRACSVGVGASTEVGRTLECDDDSRTPGTHHYAVVARQGAAWRAESPRRPFSADLTGPSTTLTDPSDGYRGSAFLLRLGLLFSCGAAPACGTAGDPSGVDDVRWSLSFRPAGGGQLRCWDGGRFVAPDGTSCVEGGAVVEAAADGVRWRLPGTSDGPFRDRGTYTLEVIGLDGFANRTRTTAVVTLV